MKSPIYKLLLSVVMGILLMAHATFTFAASVPWQSYSDDAFTSAKTQNKLVLIYIKSDTCHWCEKMNDETFNSPTIINLISKKFIPVTVDTVADSTVYHQFGASGTPTFIILNSNGHEVSREVGYQTPSEFKSYIAGF